VIKKERIADLGYRDPVTRILCNGWHYDLHVASIQQWWMQEGAHAMLHSTKPQTLAYGLNDSPIGPAAWLVEKYRSWSDCDGDIERRFSRDDLLTHIMLYWVTGTIASSIRLYYEDNHAPPAILSDRSSVPIATARVR
jgi:hypothetical protein